MKVLELNCGCYVFLATKERMINPSAPENNRLIEPFSPSFRVTLRSLINADPDPSDPQIVNVLSPTQNPRERFHAGLGTKPPVCQNVFRAVNHRLL